MKPTLREFLVLLLVLLVCAWFALAAAIRREPAQPDKATVENGVQTYHFTVTAKRPH
jgi:hypothetical protein